MFNYTKMSKIFAILAAAAIVVGAAVFFLAGVKGDSTWKGGSQLVYTVSEGHSSDDFLKAVSDSTGCAVNQTALTARLRNNDKTELVLVFGGRELDEAAVAAADEAVKSVDSAAERVSDGKLGIIFNAAGLLPLLISIGIIAVIGFVYCTVRFRKTLGMKSALLALIVAVGSPLLAAALAVNLFIILSIEAMYLPVIVSAVATVIFLVAAETVLAGKLAGTAKPFGAEAVNGSLGVLAFGLSAPMLVLVAVFAVVGAVMLFSGVLPAAHACFAIAAALFSAVYLPLYVAAPALAKK